jgi:hypothetical protein
MGPRPFTNNIKVSSDDINKLILDEMNLEHWESTLSNNELEVWHAYQMLTPPMWTYDDCEHYANTLREHGMPVAPQGDWKDYLNIWERVFSTFADYTTTNLKCKTN